MRFDEQLWITVVDKGLLALILLIAGLAVNWMLERLKSQLALELDGTKTRNAVVVELIKKLAAGSHLVSWLAWSGKHPGVSLSNKDFDSYQKDMRALMSELVGLQASVAAFDSPRFDLLGEHADTIYSMDEKMGEAREKFLSGKHPQIEEAKKMLAALYDEALAFDDELLRSASTLKLQRVDI